MRTHAAHVTLALLLALTAGLPACGESELDEPAMTITAVSPDPVQQGELLRLYGDFGAEPDEARATVAGVCTALVAWTPGVVTIVVPRGAGVGSRLVVLQREGRALEPRPITISGTPFPQDTAYCGEDTSGGPP